MPAYVALLRAVNVGGAGALAMEDLQRLCLAAGFTRVVGEAGSALVLGGGSLTLAAAVATQAERHAWNRAVALGITLAVCALIGGALWVKWRDDGC